jgi:D-alanyl-lipoteichoic acid acyltransferase DltB (MBOAT superfamily)
MLLLVASYYFYMSWNPKYVVLILFTTVISYGAARLLENETSQTRKKSILSGAVVLCLGVLFFFKYFNFISESVADLLGLFTIQLHPITLNLLLPVGISFYTFQTLSYVIDVYKGEIPAEHHFGIYATYISFFPQLVAGPIERAENLLPQMNSEKQFDYDQAMYGARQMLWGFFKKIAVADAVAVYVDLTYENLSQCTAFDICIAIFFFTIQIYCDFSGYSDIAIGTAKLLGINLMENFASPYFVQSVQEFWSRWHISLSTWFRDYVYIPLGGNRCSKLKNYFNLMVTFLVSGLWHGANWTFVVWGGIHGLAQVIEKAFKLRKNNSNKLYKVMSWIIVFAFCNLAWVFFRADSIADAAYVISHVFAGLGNISLYLHTSTGLNKQKFLYIVILIMVVALYDYISLKKNVIEALGRQRAVVRIVIEYLVLFCIIKALIDSTGTNQFVYFQF